MSRGWFYNDDFALLMQASHRSLGWNYLRMPINDHLLPGLRLEFWLLRHTSPLNHPLTIGARLLLQVGGTALLLLLLRTLTGRRRRVLVVTALYAFCPLVLTNSLWLTVALALLPAQALVLAALYAHVRYSVTGRLRWAALAGLCLLGGALFWEKVAVSAVLLPILSLGYLHDGTLRQRLAASLRQWRGWLATAAPITAFTAYFAAAGYGGAATAVSPPDLLGVLWVQWSRVISPSLLGGPWSWFKDPNVSLGYASAGTVVALLTQLGFAALVVLGMAGRPEVAAGLEHPGGAAGARHHPGRPGPVRVLRAVDSRHPQVRRRPRRPAVPRPGAGGHADLGGGDPAAAGAGDRYATRAGRGPSRPPDDRAAAPMTRRCPIANGAPPGRGRRTAVLVGAAALAVLWLTGSLLSVADFSRHLGANPAHRYVTALKANIARPARN